jgi:metal transporter CNNM
MATGTDHPDRHVHSEPHVHVGFGTTLFWWYIAFILALVLLGGVFSGLTLGLMGLDTVSCVRSFGVPVADKEVNLQVLSIAGTADERRQAPKVLRLIRAGRHTMLVMLLLGQLVLTLRLT